MDSLVEFLAALKDSGASDEFIVALLKQNGWSEKRIYQAFGSWYETRTGLAIPHAGGRIEAAKDAFLYLLAFITLGIWAIQLGALFFTAIDRSFPNPALNYSNQTLTDRSLSNQLAAILVAFPLFVVVTRAIIKAVQGQPERLESSVRKWLTYLALVITATTMIGDVVTFLAYFLRGDLSTRFVLKVLTVLVIAGGIFAYYLDSLRQKTIHPGRNRFFGLGAFAIVALGLIVGFIQIGSPSLQRVASEDARRLSDLSAIAQGLHRQWLVRRQAGFTLPTTIQEIQQIAGETVASILDPISGRPYEYHSRGGNTYILCATFSRSSPADVPVQWRHPAGHACFTRDASEEVQNVPRPW
ncbi:MAG: hypothetical protein JO108_04180 [Acidobacteriaceae bacterium]|nr:hypothetical protein [Acidobacteriaceae bacterium]